MTTLRAAPHASCAAYADAERQRATTAPSDVTCARSGDARDVVRAREDARRRLAV